MVSGSITFGEINNTTLNTRIEVLVSLLSKDKIEDR